MKHTKRTWQELKKQDKKNLLEVVGVTLPIAKRQAAAMGRDLWACPDCYFIVNTIDNG